MGNINVYSGPMKSGKTQEMLAEVFKCSNHLLILEMVIALLLEMV